MEGWEQPTDSVDERTMRHIAERYRGGIIIVMLLSDATLTADSANPYAASGSGQLLFASAA